MKKESNCRCSPSAFDMMGSLYIWSETEKRLRNPNAEAPNISLRA